MVLGARRSVLAGASGLRPPSALETHKHTYSFQRSEESVSRSHIAQNHTSIHGVICLSHLPSIMTDAARVDPDAPSFEQRWALPPLCEVPGCRRIRNLGGRYCCSYCRHSLGHAHQPYCERREVRRISDAYRAEIERERSRSRSPRAKAMPRQAVDAPSAPTSQAVDAPSAPTSTSIEPRQTPAAASDEIPICEICHERLRFSGGASLMLSCGHLYCTDCWQRYLQTEGLLANTESQLRTFSWFTCSLLQC